MNGLLQKELLSLIIESKEGIAKGLEFAQSKAPELINQILAFGMFSNLMVLYAGVFLILLCAVLSYLAFKLPSENAGIAGFIIGVTGLIMSLVSGYNLVQIKTAPYVYLINYVKGD